jgi:uracil phosphoribosyltransferase
VSEHGLPNLVVVRHPLVQHKLTRIQDRRTGARDFKAKDAGATRIRLICLAAAPPGVRRMLDSHPDVPIHAAAPDRDLDARHIRPGLGDAGDRLFGTE